MSQDISYMQVAIFAAEDPEGMCLAIENQVSCRNVNFPGQSVCAWGNVMLQPCTQVDEVATLDQKWVYDSITGSIMPVGTREGLSANLCLTLCMDTNWANGACSLVANNVGEAHIQKLHALSVLTQAKGRVLY